MTAELKSPPVLAPRTPAECPSSLKDIIAAFAVALVLFAFVLFTILVGSEIDQDGRDQQEIPNGINGL